MALTREQKAELLKELTVKFSEAKTISFSDYRGLTVEEMKELRTALREEGIEYKVAKKTLLRLAAKEAGLKEIPAEALEGPVGTAFSNEGGIAPFKIVQTCSKKFEKLTLLGGIMDGNTLGKKEANQLASLPSKKELIAQLIGSMKAPISGFYGVLHGVMRKFVGTVDAYREQQEKAA